MAIIRKLERMELQRDVPHKEVDCTYSVLRGSDGEVMIQIDTYGSADRQIANKKSQSLRFSATALNQLRQILAKECS